MRNLYFACTLLFSFLGFSQTLDITPFATGFTSPVEIAHPKDDVRLFVVEKTGIIKILNSDGTTNPNPFLVLSPSSISTNGERGLLGMAFHPNYNTNGYFYLNYTNPNGNTIIARYSVDATNPNLAINSGTTLLTVIQPSSNHNGGTIKFGPDGYLYIGMGDGGGSGDPSNYAQNISSNLGKMLRIDVDSASPYGIPSTNPYVGIEGNDEIWAIGLRNPWKFSFNRLNGDLWIADVGQGKMEEINKISSPLTGGLNFGWRCYEGTEPYNTNGCASAATMTFPFAEYNHTQGCSITGGYIYTGNLYPALSGKYIFADYCKNRLGTVNENGTITYTAFFENPNSFSTFGEDKNGELYVANIDNGNIYKIIDSSLGVNTFNNIAFTLFPNPADNQISITTTTPLHNAKIEVYDFLGRSVLQTFYKNHEDNFNLNIEQLNSGIYIVVLKQNDKLLMQKKLQVL